MTPPINDSILYGQAEGLRHEAIRSLLEDREGNIWVGTFGGLHQWNRSLDQIQYIEQYFEVPQFIVLDILEDSQQHLWVSGFGLGVYRIDRRTHNSTLFQHDPADIHSLSSNIVLSLKEDQQSNLWLGTQGGGLNLLVPVPDLPDSTQFRHWRPYNSALPDETIRNIHIGKNNDLWLNTGSGLFTFKAAEEELTSYQLPGVSRRFHMDTKASGSGSIYLRDHDQAYRFAPDSISQNLEIPPVFLTNLEINGQKPTVKNSYKAGIEGAPLLDQSIPFTTDIALKYWQNDLTFEFSTLNFIQPERNRYQFKLEGYDEDWIKTDAWNRRIRYTNLSPGQYHLKVIASNNDGFWNEEGQTLAVHISPPWWRTWWAYVLYVVTALAAIIAIYRFQLNRRLIKEETVRLKELDAAKTRLFMNVTHEFRTPLTVILGMAQKVREAPEEWLEEGLDAIHRSGQQQLRLVNQMLDLTRLETRSMPIHYQQGDVVAYLVYLVQSYTSYAASRKIKLQVEKTVEELVMDFAPDALIKIAGNLLTNAIKFTPERGTITVGMQAKSNVRHLEISISDTGPGIAEDHLAHIFDRFYQVSTPITRTSDGTGIGLALAKELVEIMEGNIRVESALGEGSTFVVSLPIRNTAPMADNLAPVPPNFVLKEVLQVATPEDKVDQDLPIALIIEDNRDVATYIASCLQPRYFVHTAVNGKIGLQKALELIPDIIVCDVMMPEMDGYQACYMLKNDHKTSHIPVIMLTAKVDHAARLEGLRRGADAYLTKPFDPEELALRLQNLMALRKKIQAQFVDFPRTQDPTGQQFMQENDFLEQIKAAILEHLTDENYGIAEVCAALGTSRSQLHRKLKALTNKSTSLVIRSIRLEEARKRLLQPNLTISDVAYQVGFGNPAYFSTVFSKHFGMSPKEMRENQHLQQ